MGLADGPTEVHKATVARQVLRDYQASDDLWPTDGPRKRAAAAGQVRRATSSTKWGTCDRRHRRSTRPALDWMDGAALPGKGEPLEPRFISGGTPERDLRDPPRRPARRAAHPAAGAPPDRDEGIMREWRIIEALDGTDVPHTAGDRGVHRHVGARPPFYLMGFVDGWSPMDLHRRRGRRRSTPTSTRAQGLAYQLVEGIALLSQGRLAGEGPRGPRPARRLPRAPGRPLDRVPRAHQGPRAPGLRRGGGVAARATSRSTSSPASCTATTSSPT